MGIFRKKNNNEESIATEPVAGAGSAAGALPSTEMIREEYERVDYNTRFRGTVRSTTNILIVVAAVAVLVAVLLLPILRIYGTSMHGTLDSGDLVVSVKNSKFKTGDIIAFYYNNNILVKRVIGNSGDWVDVDLDGNVFVNQQQIDEPYLEAKSYGEDNTNIDLPYQVPEDKIFVMGDNRSVSIDSRNSSIGCVSSEQVVGKIVFRVWPLTRFGPVR
jgi:signal peptidase I